MASLSLCHRRVCVVSLRELVEHARQLTKRALRQPVVDRLAAHQDEDVENIVNFLTQDAVQQALGRYLQSLKKPKQSN